MLNTPEAPPNGTTTAEVPQASGQSPNGHSDVGTPAPTLEEQLVEARRQGAEEERRKFEPQYRGLQRTHEQTRQRVNQLEQERSKVLSGIPAMQQVIMTIAGKTLTQEELQALALKVENDQLKSAQTLPEPSPAANSQADDLAPADARQKILRYWGGARTPIKVDDGRLDWATDEPHTPEGAQRARDRFVDSLREAERQEAERRVKDGDRQQRQTQRTEAGAERTLPTEPTGPVTSLAAMASSNPADWDSRKLMTAGFEAIDSEAARRVQRKSMRQEQDTIAAREQPNQARREEVRR